MSERYGKCRICDGMGETRRKDPVLCTIRKRECATCGGTGMSGDAMDQHSSQARAEAEGEKKTPAHDRDDRRS